MDSMPLGALGNGTRTVVCWNCSVDALRARLSVDSDAPSTAPQHLVSIPALEACGLPWTITDDVIEAASSILVIGN
jgi:hypothetical protein